MKIGDTVTLARADAPSYQLPAKVDSVSSDGQLCALTAAKLPRWFRRLLQARGIFIGPTATYTFALFKDHRDQWTDTQTLNHYTITA